MNETENNVAALRSRAWRTRRNYGKRENEEGEKCETQSAIFSFLEQSDCIQRLALPLYSIWIA